MVDRIWISETSLETETQAFSFHVYADLDSAEHKFTTHVDIKQISEEGAGADFLTIKQEYQITNPIDVGSIVITAASAYALCVAWRMTDFTWEQVQEAYKNSQRNSPDARFPVRARNVVETLKRKGGDFQNHARKSLKSCLKALKDVLGHPGDDNDSKK